MRKTQIYNIVFAALFTAVIAISSQIAVAFPAISLTLQTFGVALCGYVLSVKWSLASVITYIAAGALGLPVFSFFRGGVQIVLGPTGGFILGFIALAAACSFAAKAKNVWGAVLLSAVGLFVCHLAGVLQYGLVTNTGFVASFVISSLPFLLKDIISLVAAFFVADYLKKILKKQEI